MAAVSALDQLVGKPMSVLHFGSPFVDCWTSPCTYYEFPTQTMTTIRSAGIIPFLSWSSVSTPASPDFPDSLAAVISGRYDAYIRQFALAAKAWAHPFFLRFDWEMNGNWFPWSEGINGNQPGQYVAAWRHVHDIFTSVGATNATWVWCPNADPLGVYTSPAELYPGNAYVDWTCLDGYNWGSLHAAPYAWMSFDDTFKSTYDEIANTIAPSKPMIIGEVASTEAGGSKAAWITNMLSELPTQYPQIHGVVWMDNNNSLSNVNWPIESSSSATAAFAGGIRSPDYLSDIFANLEGGPVAAPGPSMAGAAEARPAAVAPGEAAPTLTTRDEGTPTATAHHAEPKKKTVSRKRKKERRRKRQRKAKRRSRRR